MTYARGVDGGQGIVFAVEVDTDDRDEEAAVSESDAYLRRWLVDNGHTEYSRV